MQRRQTDVETQDQCWRARLAIDGGNLLFGGDGNGNFIAYNARTGKPLWRAELNVNHSNGPSTWMLDNKQYVIVGAGDTLYAFRASIILPVDDICYARRCAQCGYNSWACLAR